MLARWLAASDPPPTPHPTPCLPLYNIRAFQEAAEAAFLNKDSDMLAEVRAKCNNPKVASMVDGFLAQLSAKR